MKEAIFFPSNICRCLLKACNALNHEIQQQNKRSDCEHSMFDRLGIFALPCQTKWYNKENFHSIRRDEKTWMTVKVNIEKATLEWNF